MLRFFLFKELVNYFKGYSTIQIVYFLFVGFGNLWLSINNFTLQVVEFMRVKLFIISSYHSFTDIGDIYLLIRGL